MPPDNGKLATSAVKQKACAACGKSGDGLKKCRACEAAWYCNVNCQRDHRRAHRKECKAKERELKAAAATAGAATPPPSLANEASRATGDSDSDSDANLPRRTAGSGFGIRSVAWPEGLSAQDLSGDNISRETIGALLKAASVTSPTAEEDEDLFAPPPPRDDCAICFLPMPFLESDSTYMGCCGNSVCCGCSLASSLAIDDVEKSCCPFCRHPMPKTAQASLELMKKRLAKNDPNAFETIGAKYLFGESSLPKDEGKGFEYILRAAELGSARACFIVADCYYNGRGVEINEPMNRHYLKLAAKGGHIDARRILGDVAKMDGNFVLAVKHWRISAAAGNTESLKRVGESFQAGLVTKDEYAADLRAHQKALDAVKSKERDMWSAGAAAVLSEEHRGSASGPAKESGG